MDAPTAITVRLDPVTAERLKAIADAEYRTTAAHLRALIEADIADRDGKFEAALGDDRP